MARITAPQHRALAAIARGACHHALSARAVFNLCRMGLIGYVHTDEEPNHMIPSAKGTMALAGVLNAAPVVPVSVWAVEYRRA